MLNISFLTLFAYCLAFGLIGYQLASLYWQGRYIDALQRLRARLQEDRQKVQVKAGNAKRLLMEGKI